MKKILVINPGSTSTKVALFESDSAGDVKEIASKSLTHSAQELDKFESTSAQEAFRAKAVSDFLKENEVVELDCCAGRGAPVKALSAGSYGINSIMLEELRTEKYSNHASNLGALIAHSVAAEFKCPSLIADPVSVDEFEPFSRYSGLPGVNRRSRLHALNIRAMARRAGAGSVAMKGIASASINRARVDSVKVNTTCPSVTQRMVRKRLLSSGR